MLNEFKDLIVPGRRYIRALQSSLTEQQQQLARLEAELRQAREQLDRCQQATTEGDVALHERLTVQQGWFGEIGMRFDEMAAALEARFEGLTNDIRQATALESQLKFERNRIDYLLAAQEGILDQMDAFHQARATPEYQAAFTIENPLVSVCVVTSSRPDLLIDRCIASLQQQTYRNLQIIVVGDHCTDTTPARMAALKDSRISFHNLPERGPYPPPGRDRWCVAGTLPANKALSLCEGQFVTHLDDDDRFELDRIEIMVREAQQARADICWHPYWYEREDGTWYELGNGNFESGQIGTDTIFYHRYLARVPWNSYCYRIGEPGDWNRLRKIAMLRPRKHFVNRPLAHHYCSVGKQPFIPQEGERFLE